MSEWMPIETCPTDQDVLLCVMHDRRIAIGARLRDKASVHEGTSYQPLDYYSHWMPLPEPPK